MDAISLEFESAQQINAEEYQVKELPIAFGLVRGVHIARFCPVCSQHWQIMSLWTASQPRPPDRRPKGPIAQGALSPKGSYRLKAHVS